MSAPGEMGGIGPAGFRVTPSYSQPTPNSEPMGAITGTPVRPRMYSLPLQAGAAMQIIGETRENRLVLITPPNVAFTIFVGDAGVTPDVGLPLIGGQSNEIVLPGYVSLFAVSNSPVVLRIGIFVGPILMAERERRL